MPLKIRRSHYQQLTEFEQGRIIDLRERAILQKFVHCAGLLAAVYTATSEVEQQKDLAPGGPRGTTESEDRRVRRMALVQSTASEAEIRVAVFSQ